MIQAPLFHLVKYYTDKNLKTEAKNNDFPDENTDNNKKFPTFYEKTFGLMGAANGWSTEPGSVMTKTDGVAMGYSPTASPDDLQNYIICTDSGIRLQCKSDNGSTFKIFLIPSGAYYQYGTDKPVQLTGAAQGTAVFG